MVPASVAEVMPKVESIMWVRRILRGPFSEAMGLIPTDDEVIYKTAQSTPTFTRAPKSKYEMNICPAIPKVHAYAC